MPEDYSRRTAAEERDAEPRAVVGAAAAILVVLVLAGAAIWGLLRLFGLPADAGPNARAPDARMAAPRLQSAPQDERTAYFAEKEKLLHSYGWVDRRAGTVRIPIEVAMERLAGTGKGTP